MRVSKKAILAELEKTYPDARPELNFRNPYETLVAVMLSAQCTDKQVNKVTPALFERYPDVESMAAASVEDVYPMVKSCGFKSKATNIVESCRLICQKYGGQVPGDMDALQTLPGVGRKTANLVSGDIYGKPGVVVADTHCIRMANRIGFVTDTTDPVQVERALVKVLPPEESNDFCHRCVMHGRVVCTARKALCEVCCLQDVCRTGKKTIKQETLEELI